MVALDGPNSAEYLLIWFALEGVGGGISFINSHLTGTPLTHSVKLCECRYLIAERSMDNLVGPHVDELSQAGVMTIFYDQDLLESFTDSTPLPEERRKDIDAMEIRHLIYTSGISPHDLDCVLLLTRYRHHRLAKGRHVRSWTTHKHSTKCS
jgi:acyl-CoA synthetase (AMP-forming)/AMP-acid ligase II